MAPFLKAGAVEVDDDGGDVEQGELQIGHVDAFEIDVRGGDVKLLLAGACVGWSAAGTSCFTGGTSEAFCSLSAGCRRAPARPRAG